MDEIPNILIDRVISGGAAGEGKYVSVECEVGAGQRARLLARFEHAEAVALAWLTFRSVTEHWRKDHGMALSPGVPVANLFVEPATDRSSLVLHLIFDQAGHTRIPVCLPVALARRLAASLLKRADEVDPPRAVN